MNSYITAKKLTGFTLLECMTIISIISVVLSMAIPSYSDYAGNNLLKNNINYLSASMQYARSQAVTLKKEISICASEDQSECSNRNSWESGWIIFYVNDDEKTILRVQDSLRKGTMRSNGLTSESILSFDRSGSIKKSQSGGTFTSCDDRGESDARALIVNNVGFVHVGYDQDENGVQNDHAGNDVKCPS